MYMARLNNILRGLLGLTFLRQSMVFIILSSMCFSFSFATNNTNEPLSDQDDIKGSDAKTLVVEGDINYPPFEFIDKNGQPAGLNIDLTKALLDKLGISNYKITLKKWTNVLDDYHEGKVDLIMGMYYYKERASKYIFGTVHGSYYQDVVFRKGTGPYKTFNDLKGKKVLVEAGSSNYDLTVKNGLKDEITKIYDNYNALKLLSTGKYDAYIGEQENVYYLIKHLKLNNLKVVDIGVPALNYCFVGKSKEFLFEIERAFYEVRADGTYDHLKNKWFNNEKFDINSISQTIYIIILLLIICALILAIFNALLRKKVNSAKLQLNSQNQRLALAMKAGDIIVWGFNVKTKIYFNVECNIFPPKGRAFEEEVACFHPDDQALYRKTIKDLSNGEIVPKEMCFRIDYTGKNNWRYIEKNFVQIKDKYGNVETIIGTHRDVTESKLYQSRMKDMVDKYHTIFSSTSVGLEYYDANGILCDLNNIVCKIFELQSRNEVINKRYSLFENPILKNLISRDSKQAVQRIIKIDFDKLNKQYVSYRRTGICYLDINIKPSFNEVGDINCYIVSYSDITDMHFMQKQLREYIRKTDFAIKAANIVFWEYDSTTQMITSYNDPLNHFDTNTKSYLYDISKFVHPNDTELLSRNLEKIKQGVNASLSIDVRIWYEDTKQWHNVTITAIPFDVNDNNFVSRYVGVRNDNTTIVKMTEDLKNYTEKMDYVLKQSGIQIWSYNIGKQEFTILSASNELYEKMSLSEYINRIDESEKETVRALYDKMNKGEEGEFSNLRKLNYSKSGKGDMYIIFNGIPIKNDEGKVTSYFGLRRNVTALIETQNKLKSEMIKAQQADKLKSAFLANMSHEIRTPLNAIVGFSNLLQVTVNEDERSEFIKLINANNDLLIRLIDDILDLSKIESGVMEMAKTEFDISLCFDERVSTLREKNLHPNVKFICNNPYQQCIICSDNNRISQIITNFVSNALKYTSKGYVKSSYSYENGGIYIKVEDTGIGIDKSKQHLIFQRFEKLDNFAQGTGLGLSICKAIVDSFEGKIGFESEKDKGSTFWAWIPCQLVQPIIPNENDKQSNIKSEQQHQISISSDDKEAQSEDNHITTKHILIAEDNDSNFLLLQAYLKGYELSRANNGKEAVDMTMNHPFDLVLMDVKMQVMDGLTAVKLIREAKINVPIIALTANAFDNDKEKALSAGCNDYLTKPIREKELIDTIQHYI